jgi:hypothetical protein
VPDTGTGSATSRSRWSTAAPVVLAVPLVTAAVRAIVGGWYPMSDNAFFALRARDVLSEHHPWIGTWSSASLSADLDVNNPGPLLFDWLAAPAAIDPEAGLVVGVVALHLVMLGVAAWFGARRGTAAAAVVVAMGAALVWTMGSDVVVEPWQPHSLLTAFLCYLVLIWSLACGDRLALPAVAVVGTLLVQTHLSYAILVVGLGTVGAAGWARATRERTTVGRRELRLTPLVAVTVGVLVVLWAQPLAEQVAGDGNLGRIVRSAGSDDPPGGQVGVPAAARVVAAAVALPPWWARPSMSDTLDDGGRPSRPEQLPRLPSTALAVTALTTLAAMLAYAGRRAGGRGEEPALVAVVIAGSTVLLALVTTAVIPIGELGFAAHAVRWLWPVAVFVTGALVLALLRPRWTLVGSFVAAVGFAVLAIPAHRQEPGPSAGPSSADANAAPVFRDLLPQLDVLEGRGTLLVEIEGLRLYEPYSTPLMLELERRGIPFVVDHPWSVRQVGEGRRFDGDADAVVYIADGPAAEQPRPGAERVAYAARTGDAGPVGVFVMSLEDR